MPNTDPAWFVYILRCADGSLYTGITTDLDRRLREHEHGLKGAKYLRGRLPVALVFSSAVRDRSQASRVEIQIKRLRKVDKERLINGVLTIASLERARPVSSPGAAQVEASGTAP